MASEGAEGDVWSSAAERVGGDTVGAGHPVPGSRGHVGDSHDLLNTLNNHLICSVGSNQSKFNTTPAGAAAYLVL
jgi:hypothetical protein